MPCSTYLQGTFKQQVGVHIFLVIPRVLLRIRCWFKKTMNKAVCYSHFVPMDPLLYKLSPYRCHTTQSIIIKDGKNNCIIWDGSTFTQPTYIVINQVTPVSQEAPVTFGHVKSQIYMDIYDTRINYPNAAILLDLADVKASFRYPRSIQI